MEHSPDVTETPEPDARPVDALARVSRFFRRAPVAAGELPVPEVADESTAEFDVLDLRNAEGPEPLFPPVLWGGYDRGAVEARIAELEDELAELRASIDPERVVEREIRQLSDETAEILRVAHAKADAMVKKAQADADGLIAGAEKRAAAMIADAEQRLRRIDNDTDVVWAERMRLTEDTRRLADTLRQVADSAAQRFPPEQGAPED